MIVKEKIGPRFKEGICCCQQVFEELAPTLGLDEKTALRIAAGFGSGIGHGLTCGAVTAGLMALGLKYGNHIPGDDEGKARMNEIRLAYEKAFIEKNGSLLCKELLGYDPSVPEDKQAIVENDLFSTICPDVVCNACEILREMLASEDAAE